MTKRDRVRTDPRNEYFFHTIQGAQENDYKPKKSRDEELVERFKGRKGIIVPFQQMIGLNAGSKSFDAFVDKGDRQSLGELSQILGVIGTGTAFYNFAKDQSDQRMYRRTKLARVYDQGEIRPVSEEEHIERVRTGLARAAEIGNDIFEGSFNGRDIDELDESLGYTLAHTASGLAVLHRELLTSNVPVGELEGQQKSYEVTHQLYSTTNTLTALDGIRPSAAQLPDPRSKLRVRLADDHDLAPQATYKKLVRTIKDEKKAA